MKPWSQVRGDVMISSLLLSCWFDVFTRTWLPYVRVFVIANRSVVSLSSVTFVRPTRGIGMFGNISSPFCTLAILWPPCKILQRSSHGNPSVRGVKRKRGSKIERIWTYQRPCLIPMSRSGLSSPNEFILAGERFTATVRTLRTMTNDTHQSRKDCSLIYYLIIYCCDIVAKILRFHGAELLGRCKDREFPLYTGVEMWEEGYKN